MIWPDGAEPQKIMMAGDWHGNTKWACYIVTLAAELLKDEPFRIVVQCGDFGIWYGKYGDAYLNTLSACCEEKNVYVMFIDGNHEAFPRLHKMAAKAEKKFGGYEIKPNLIWMDRGTTAHVGNKRWMFLGGATSLDKQNRTEGESWFAEEAISDEDEHYAVSKSFCDVMITHDCPSLVVHAYPDFGFPAEEIAKAEEHSRKLQDIVNHLKPSYLIHGHLHIAYQKPVLMPYGDCIVTGLGRDGDEANWFVLDLDSMEFLPHPEADYDEFKGEFQELSAL